MVNAIKLKAKLNKKIFSSRIGSDITINQYSLQSRDTRGVKTKVLMSSITIKCVKEKSVEYSFKTSNTADIKEGDIYILYSGDYSFVEDTNTVIEWVYNNVLYKAVRTEVIGDIQNLFGGIVISTHLRLI